jgi:hypothetical protein
MKTLFTNLWLQLLAVTVIAFAPGIWKYLGLLLWFAYFIAWANNMYNEWNKKS